MRGGAVVPALGLREVAPRDRDGAEPGLGARVVREQRERVAVLLGGRAGVTRFEQQRRELDARPLRVLGRARAGLDGAAHEAGRARDVALQLARVAETRVGDEAGAQVAEAREGGEALLVATELDRGVADHGERRRREAVRERERALAQAQRLAEIVVGERQRAVADRGVEPAGSRLSERSSRVWPSRSTTGRSSRARAAGRRCRDRPAGAALAGCSCSRLWSSLTCVASPVSDVTGSSVARTALGAACGVVELHHPAGRPAGRPRRRSLRSRARALLVWRSPGCGCHGHRLYLLPELGLLRYGNAFPKRPPLASFDGHAVGAELEQADRPGVREVRAAEREQRVRALDARGDEVVDRQADQRGDLDVGDVVTEAPAVRIAVELGRGAARVREGREAARACEDAQQTAPVDLVGRRCRHSGVEPQLVDGLARVTLAERQVERRRGVVRVLEPPQQDRREIGATCLLRQAGRPGRAGSASRARRSGAD